MASSEGDPICVLPIMLIMGIILLYSGITRFLLKQKIQNTPTSKVRSAAIGLVEIFGKALCKDNVLSPISKEKCVFWKLNAQYYRQGKHGGWKNIYSKEYSMPFYLKDETGQILIDPKGGEMTLPLDFQSKGGLSGKALFGLLSVKQLDARALDYMKEDEAFARSLSNHRSYELKVTETFIAEGDPLYVLGSAMPIKGASSAVSNENIFVCRSDSDKILYISDSGEKKVLENMNTGIIVGLGGGFLLTMAAVIGLLLYFKVY